MSRARRPPLLYALLFLLLGMAWFAGVGWLALRRGGAGPGGVEAAGVLAFLVACAVALHLLLYRRPGAEPDGSGDVRHRLRLLLEGLPAITWTVDRDLTFVASAGRGLGALGLEPGQTVGMKLTEYFGTDDPDFLPLRAHLRALEGESASYRTEWQGRIYQALVEPLREGGEIGGVIGVALDVTPQLEAERKLVEQRVYWEKLFDESPEAIVLLDAADRVLEANREFQRLFGYSPDEARGRRINDLIVPHDRQREGGALTRHVAKGDRIAVEAIRERKDGSRIHVSILGTPLDVMGERRVYGIYRDITERKELEAQLLHSQRLEAVGQLAGGVAHDFNNLLTAILGHVRILLGEMEEGWMRDDLREIEGAAERAAGLTRELLTFSRRDLPRREPVDVNAVVRGAEGLLRSLLGERVEMEMRLAPELPAVPADPRQVDQVLMNLVINSRDAMPEGGRLVVATRRVARGGPPGAGDVVLEVSDDGEGMPPEVRARMFEPFFTTKGPGQGTGLGLSTIFGIVERSQGWIEVDTVPGEGTTVRIFLPVVPAGVEEGAPEPSSPPAAAGDGCVLLVEDDRSVREVTRRILERHGYSVVAVASGEEALRVLRSTDLRPDLLLADLRMDGMSGKEVAARVEEGVPGIEVLFMSGHTDTELAGADPGGRGSRFLLKPFQPETLARRVREILGSGR